jgi:hypothetical protein
VAVGGTLNRWNGSGWTALAGPASAGRSLSWGVASPSDMYAVGDSASTNRAFYRFDGTSWREVGRLTFTTGASRVWADPRGGAAYVSPMFQGGAPRVEMVTPTLARVLSYSPQLRDVAMPTTSSAFVVGANFFLARWNGARWNVDAPPLRFDSNGMWTDRAMPLPDVARAFYRPVGSGEGYVLGFEEIFRKIDETIAVGGVQLLLQGGHNPDLPLSWFEDLFRAVKERYPSFKLHALSPPEVIHLSRLSQLPVESVLRRLLDAGLDSIPGGGAEILVDRVRKLLHCYGKATADEWLDVMRHAHRAASANSSPCAR